MASHDDRSIFPFTSSLGNESPLSSRTLCSQVLPGALRSEVPGTSALCSPCAFPNLSCFAEVSPWLVHPRPLILSKDPLSDLKPPFKCFSFVWRRRKQGKRWRRWTWAKRGRNGLRMLLSLSWRTGIPLLPAWSQLGPGRGQMAESPISVFWNAPLFSLLPP